MIGSLENATLGSHTDSTAAKVSYHSHSYLNSYLRPPPCLHHHLEARDVHRALRRALGSDLRQSAATGILAVVKWICAVIIVSTMSAASVMGLTELETKESVSQLSTSDCSNRRQEQQLEAAMRKAREAVATGTRQLKRKAADGVSELPRFKRGFVWDRSLVSSPLFPSALATELAPPLASLPSHLLNDPVIQSLLHAMRDFI